MEGWIELIAPFEEIDCIYVIGPVRLQVGDSHVDIWTP